jgi:hypothetical protein
MVRTSPFTYSDISKRKEVKIEPHLLEKLVRSAHVPDAGKSRFAEELEVVLHNFKVRDLGDRQERPRRVIATLNKGLSHTENLLSWIRSLPPSVLIDLKIGNVEKLLSELITGIDVQAKHYKARVVKHRPAGTIWVRESLQRDLTDIHQRLCPESDRGQREAWVARALSEMKVAFPNEKKDRKRFRSFETRTRLSPSRLTKA